MFYRTDIVSAYSQISLTSSKSGGSAEADDDVWVPIICPRVLERDPG